MHVAKTSGTALTAGLREATAPILTVTGFDRVMFGGFDGFESLSPDVRRTVHDTPASLPPKADFIHGHFSLSTTCRRYPQAQFLTVLRAPKVRLLSLVHYWRAQTAETMSGWGTWVDVVARSQLPLADFLNDPIVACQTDNMVLRMLLWPHPLIPDAGFIQPGSDVTLLAEAARLIGTFDYLDVMENTKLERNLEEWLERPFNYRRLNETDHGDAARRPPLHRELTDKAFDRLDACSRLDVRLWDLIAKQRIPGADVRQVAEQAMLQAVMRYAQ